MYPRTIRDLEKFMLLDRVCQPPVGPIVMPVRHSQSRYAYPEDRKNFKRWLNATGPCNRPYRWLNKENRRLIIDIQKKGRRLCYEIPHDELVFGDWRKTVARAVRMVRSALSTTMRERKSS